MRAGGTMASGGDLDAVSLARDAVRRNQPHVLASIVENHPLELWFGMPVSEFQMVLKATPAQSSEVSPGVTEMLRNFINHMEPPPQKLVASDIAHMGGEDAHAFVEAGKARLSGDSVKAFQMMRGLNYAITAVPQLVDSSRGMRSFTLLQTAVSGMLAGKFSEALIFFEKSLVPPIPKSLEFFARDAHLRSSLIHALYGSHREAHRHLKAAQAVPRTDSWVEVHLDADEKLAEALLTPHERAGEALDAVFDISVRQYGEMWPFYVVGIYQLSLRAHRRAEGRNRVESLQAMGLTSPQGSGFAGSVFALVLALDAILSGTPHRARTLLNGADTRVWMTKLLLAIHPTTTHPRMVRLARSVSASTRGLEQAEEFRQFVLTLAEHSARDDGGDGMALMDSLPQTAYFYDSLAPVLTPDRLEPQAGKRDEPVKSNAQTLRSLTPRELEILELLAVGYRRAEIASSLFVSVNTVKSHQRNLYKKLGVDSASAAIAEAQDRGLL